MVAGEPDRAGSAGAQVEELLWPGTSLGGARPKAVVQDADADSRMETVADRDVLLVRRFDRERTGAGYRRHRRVSALTLLRAGDSPVDRVNWSYLLLADEVRRASPHPRTDLRELFGRMCSTQRPPVSTITRATTRSSPRTACGA